MKTKLDKAINSNHGIYEAVFDSWGIRWNRNESIWYCTEKVPPLNSNLVTRALDWKPDKILAKIDAASKAEGWEGWSIKDSFQTLSLAEYGFAVLLDAQWLYLKAASFFPVQTSLGLTYTIVEGTHALSLWRTAWEKNNTARAEAIYRDAILKNSNVFFVLGRDSMGGVISLCLLNKTEDVIGIRIFILLKPTLLPIGQTCSPSSKGNLPGLTS